MTLLGTKSAERLDTCHADLKRLILAVAELRDVVVAEGHRGQEAQDRAFEEGKSEKKWPFGRHNNYPSDAVDVAPYWREEGFRWEDFPAFAFLMGQISIIARQLGIKVKFGLDWDGDFRIKDDSTLIDGPHIELIK